MEFDQPDTLGGFALDLAKIKDWCECFWQNPQHPHFNLHGVCHSDSIARKLNEWLSYSTIELTPTEAFVLSSAIYLHDIGMQCRDRGFLERFAEIPAGRIRMPLDYADLELVRKHHADLSYQMILDACKRPRERDYPETKLDCTRRPLEMQAAAKICRHHMGTIGQGITNNYAGVPEGPIRLLLLQHLLRIGDTLDADAGRVSRDYINSVWESLLPKDRYHVLKHQYVTNMRAVGAGVFCFTYGIPDSERDLLDDIRICTEAPLRQHLNESGPLIRQMGIPFSEVACEEVPTASTPFPVDDATRECFRQEADRLQSIVTASVFSNAALETTTAVLLPSYFGPDTACSLLEISKNPEKKEKVVRALIEIDVVSKDPYECVWIGNTAAAIGDTRLHIIIKRLLSHPNDLARRAARQVAGVLGIQPLEEKEKV